MGFGGRAVAARPHEARRGAPWLRGVHGCAVHVAAVPADEKDDPLDFGAAHERTLFAAGEAAMAGGHAWRDVTAP